MTYRDFITLLTNEMSKQPSFSDMFEFYLRNIGVLEDWTFIVATTEPDNMDLYAGMESISGIKERLFTPFANGRVSVINKKIVMRCLYKNDSRARIYRCISFDTQTVSYIERYYRTGSAPYVGFDEVLSFLKGKEFSVDHIPYTMENLTFSLDRKSSVEQTLFAYEMVCGKKSGREKACRKRAKKLIAMYEKANFEALFRAKEIYRLIYLALLKMSQIQLECGKLPVEQKMNLFTQFMLTRVSKMMRPEMNLAQLYFTKGSACGFFGKIHIDNKNILSQIKNMAWDLMHLRFMDYSATMFNTKKGDVLIPYFFTYDKRLQDIRTCYSLQALAYNHKNYAVIPVYALESGILDMVKEYCTFEKHMERMCSTPDLDELITESERDLMLLIR